MSDDLEHQEFELPFISENEIRVYGKLLPQHASRPPDWRFKLASLCLSRKVPKPDCDEAFKEIYRFLRRLDKILSGQDSKNLLVLMKQHPDLYSAWIIYSDFSYPRFRIELESRILAKEAPEQVIRKLGLTSGVYDWYKLAFFDVETRLDNPSFIINQVILRGAQGFNVEHEDVLLPLLGYMLGVEAIDYCIYRMEKSDFQTFLDNLDKSMKDQLRLKLWAHIQSGNVDRSEALLTLYKKLIGEDSPAQPTLDFSALLSKVLAE